MAHELLTLDTQDDPRLADFRGQVRPVLAKDLARTDEDLLWDLSETGWDAMSVPQMPEFFRASIGKLTLDSIMEQFSSYFDTAVDTRNFVFANMLQYAGVRPADPEAMSWVRLEKEYPPNISFPFATQTLFGRGRLVGVRAVPASFQTDRQLRTPFYLHGNPEGGVMFSYDDGDTSFQVTTATERRPLQSAREIAYAREIRRQGEDPQYRIIVNPLINCRERCNFCVRQYDVVGDAELGAGEPFPRSRLSPDEMAKYTFLKFEHLQDKHIESIGIVTGAFPTFEGLYKYVDQFVAALVRETDGKFDPRANDSQKIFMLTHVITEREQMEAIRELGVKNISHTLEVIDDDRRQQIMPAQSRHPGITNKADVTFEQTLAAVPPGIEVFGPNGFRVIVIIGLDDLDTTIRGASQLHEAGITSLDTSILRAHSVTTLGDYAMNFPDIMAAKQHIIDTYRPDRLR